MGIEEMELVEVELKNGRFGEDGVFAFGNYNDDCETNTNNQTKATCC